MRHLEMRIGELLGPPTPGERTDINPSVATDRLSKDERHDFSQMAAHPEVVEEVIAESTDDEPASRRKVYPLSTPRSALPSAPFVLAYAFFRTTRLP